MSDPQIGAAASDRYLEARSDAVLIALIRAIGKLYQKLDGVWYVSVMERWGNDAALERDIWVWERGARREAELMSKALGLQDKKDLAALLRVFTTSPITMTAAFAADESTPGQAEVTISSCAILEALEKEGSGREKTICSVVEQTIFKAYASYFGEGFTIEPLKLPPRSSPEEPCCRWRLTAPADKGPVVLPGPFDLTALDRSALLGLVRTYCRLYQGVDGYWYLAVKERWGNEAALEIDKRVWARLTKIELTTLAPVIGLAGRQDMEAFVELFLAAPINMITGNTVDLLDEKEAVISITACPVLRALEKEGQGREAQICRDVDPIIFTDYARAFNPAITVEAITTPPRKSPDQQPLCTWRFRLAELPY